MLLLRSASRKMTDASKYDRSPQLTDEEREAVARFRRGERDIALLETTPAPQPVAKEIPPMASTSVKCQKSPNCTKPARHKGRCPGASVTRKNAPAASAASGRRGAGRSAKRAAAATRPNPPIHHRVWGFIKRVIGIGFVG